MSVERSPVGPTLAGKGLAVDKLLAIFGRAAARDFIDLAATADRYGLETLCLKALLKDSGLEPQLLHEMLGRFHCLDRDEFEVPDLAFERLERHRRSMAGLIDTMTRDDLELRLDGVDRGDELGLDH